VLPLSARVTVALLVLSLDFMLLMVLASCWTLGVGGCLLSWCRLVICSGARFSSQLWCFVCKLYTTHRKIYH
jgi:hypothetical protein